MIAFCFLTYDEIYAEHIWTEYFRNVDPEYYKILSNPKTPNKILRQPLFKDTIIPNRFANTKWGTFSLITAQNELLKAALCLPITFIILISQNSIPVQPFDDLHNYLFYNNKSILGMNIELSHKNRYGAITRPNFKSTEFYTMSQWHVLIREHAIYITTDYDIIKSIFGKMIVPDEHAYINYLVHYKKCTNIINNNICYINWKNNDNKDNHIFERGVQIFTEISPELLEFMHSNDKFFIRKITDNININNINII